MFYEEEAASVYVEKDSPSTLMLTHFISAFSSIIFLPIAYYLLFLVLKDYAIGYFVCESLYCHGRNLLLEDGGVSMSVSVTVGSSVSVGSRGGESVSRSTMGISVSSRGSVTISRGGISVSRGGVGVSVGGSDGLGDSGV